jgi:hypothetical protein
VYKFFRCSFKNCNSNQSGGVFYGSYVKITLSSCEFESCSSKDVALSGSTDTRACGGIKTKNINIFSFIFFIF